MENMTIKRKISNIVKVFSGNGSKEDQEKAIITINSKSEGISYSCRTRPFISLKHHEEIKNLVLFMGWFYNTKKSTVHINKIEHNIIIIGKNCYFQHNNKQLVSLNKLNAHKNFLSSLSSDKGGINLKEIEHVSKFYSTILEEKRK